MPSVVRCKELQYIVTTLNHVIRSVNQTDEQLEIQP